MYSLYFSIELKMASDQSKCHFCMASLCGKQYAMKEENSYCVKCYDSLFANLCEECKKPIQCHSKVSLSLIYNTDRQRFPGIYSIGEAYKLQIGCQSRINCTSPEVMG